MKKRRISAFWSGCLATAVTVALGTTVLAASGQVTFNFANVAVDGKTTITAGTTITAANGQQVPSSILYTDAAGGKTNYLPIRTISELLGVEIGYDSATKTVLLGDSHAEGGDQESYWQRTADGASFAYISERPLTPYTDPPAWSPAWLPDGWGLSESSGSTSWSSYRYRGDGGVISFRCEYPDGGSVGASVRYEQTVQNCRQVTIQGQTADLYTEGEKTYLVWEGQDGILFWFSGNKVDAEDVIKVAESVQPVTGQMPDLQMTWAPDGYTKYERVSRGNAVQETWLGPDTSFTLLYAAVPLELPDGAPESLRVNGAEAQYWQAEEPYESSGGSMTVNGEPVEGGQAEVAGVTVSVGTVVGPNAAGVNTLAWTDPDSGLFFRLHGTLDRETLVRIAEQIR